MPTQPTGTAGLPALWKRWYRGDGELVDDPAMFAAALAALNLLGATLSVLWLVLPRAGHANEGAIVCATLAAYVLGTFLVLGPGKKRWWMFQVSIALDTLVISVALVGTHDPSSVYAFYYLWATLYAVCFFTARQIVLQAAWVCTAYAVSLIVIAGGFTTSLLSQWLLPMATLLAAGTLVRQLTGRLRRSQATLRHEAGHDSLTGLPNRALFGERLDALLAQPHDAPVAVAFIDLDHFKRVNDSLGHGVGDDLLVAVAEQLQRCAPPSASLARFGGDEFLALIPTADPDTAASQLLKAFEQPVRVGQHEFTVTASVGIAVARDGEDAQTVLCHADVAVYRAKHEGRARLAIFDDSMRAEVKDRLRLERQLRRAIERDELEVAFQPIIALADGEIVGAEALARWTDPELGPIAPDVFIALAEDCGLIDALGDRVLARACHAARRWVDFVDNFYVSVNLSPRQLDGLDLLPRIERALADSGLAGRHLLLEVTESAVLSNGARTCENVRSIRRAGIGLALDDFGTGYSSLSHLRQVSFEVLKLDRGFIAEDRSPTGDAILAAVARIGMATGARVLAEGIETAEQCDRVERLGCRFGQGWHFGRPVSAEAFGASLEAQAFVSSISPSADARATASSREATPSFR